MRKLFNLSLTHVSKNKRKSSVKICVNLWLNKFRLKTERYIFFCKQAEAIVFAFNHKKFHQKVTKEYHTA